MHTYIDRNGLVESSIEREDPAEEIRIQCLVNRENESAGTLKILGVLITPDTNMTSFKNEDDIAISQGVRA